MLTVNMRTLAFLAGLMAILMGPFAGSPTALANGRDGVVRVKSSHGVDETVERLKADIEGKGIKYFATIDQSGLAKDAGLQLKPSKLLLFGNPPLGIQFLTANPNAGLDWPVRLLVTEDSQGRVWVSYTDFNWIARRHGITDRKAQFRMASDVIRSITSSIE